MDLLKLRPLHIFCEVMRCNSVSQAARVLNITQPAVSKTLQHLESDFGLVLFKRHQGRLHPSRDAEQLFAEAQRLFGHLEHLKGRINGLRCHCEGKVSIAAVPTLADSLITQTIARFRAKRPNVHVELRCHTAMQVVELVASQQADVGLVNNFRADASIDSVSIAEAELICLLPKDHDLTRLDVVDVKRLAHDPLMTLASASPSSAAIRRILREAGLDGEVMVEASQSSTVYALVEAGAGIAVIDPLAGLSRPTSRLEIRPFRPVVRIRIEAIASHFRPLTRLGSAFMSELNTVIEEIAVTTRFIVPASRQQGDGASRWTGDV